jgi:hypothetical protein
MKKRRIAYGNFSKPLTGWLGEYLYAREMAKFSSTRICPVLVIFSAAADEANKQILAEILLAQALLKPLLG